ncbi:MAG: Rrf2 family transcriptional regulator [Candidatus Saganbacteria bacterium]|nr:Rrf2 family transcriptional regulator [Candidatus Saganbacteria bacterium]
MKISFKGDYALKAILDLSFYFDKPQSTDEISKRQDIPYKFLEQILLQLKKGGFVRSMRGRNGGYILANKPSQITLGQIVRFVDGPVEPIACIYPKDPSHCRYCGECVLREVFCDIGKLIADKVDSITFEDLKERQKKNIAKTKKYLNFSI